MEKSLYELLEGANDFELCNEVFLRIAKYHGEDIDASAIGKAERVVFLVWNAFGVIGNGGFRHLFEGTFKGDPYFALTAEAFQAIGCWNAAEAVQKALALFPQSRPQEDVQKRLRHFLKRIKGEPTEMDRQFWSAKPKLMKRLADYIRSHISELINLESPKTLRSPRACQPSDRSPERKPEARPPMADLPHWARVVFAARCARAVLPLFARHWPGAPAKHSRSIQLAIDLAEQSAGDGRPVDGIEKSVMHATMAGGAALTAGSEFNPKAMPPKDSFEGTIAASVAKSAEYAARAAMGDPGESLNDALEAWTWAQSAAESAGEDGITDALKADFSKLRRVADDGKWTDQTRVPSEIWSLL
jgi:hypothetical protein